jgi:hypothetical protein
MLRTRFSLSDGKMERDVFIQNIPCLAALLQVVCAPQNGDLSIQSRGHKYPAEQGKSCVIAPGTFVTLRQQGLPE